MQSYILYLLIVSFVAQNRQIYYKAYKMNYQDTLNWMFAQLPMFQRKGQAAYKANLDNTLALDEHFSHPHKNFKTIHVAGTNGKGSVSHMIASCLQEAGYKTALYTSPHLKDFRERIRVNGESVPKSFVVDFVENNREFFEEMKPSFFEMTVAMAFDYFASEEVEYAVIETGLGGRLDSTNIICPELSIITNISLDHTALLGGTVKEIAFEKAGIIKEGVPVIIGEYDSAVSTVFETKAFERGSEISFASRIFAIKNSIFNVDERIVDVYKNGELRFKDLKSSLVGVYQEKNIPTVLLALETLNDIGLKIDDKHIYDGMSKTVENTSIMGRWQILSLEPLTVCDTAHNEAGISCVIEQLKGIAFNHLHIVFGMVSDKSIEKVLSMMPKDASYYFTRANIPRAMDENELATLASKFDLHGETYKTVALAVKSANKRAQAKDLIYVGGSTFVVAEVV
jgi:dihydrofolate synthase/folylpolyglutamate synthase